MSDSVLVAEYPAGDRVIGRLTLNVEKTLNSLTRDMVEVITDCLETWADDARVVAVLIDGVGEKAFCAGGDVQALRNSCIETPGGPCEYAEHFFARAIDEYCSDPVITGPGFKAIGDDLHHLTG